MTNSKFTICVYMKNTYICIYLYISMTVLGTGDYCADRSRAMTVIEWSGIWLCVMNALVYIRIYILVQLHSAYISLYLHIFQITVVCCEFDSCECITQYYFPYPAIIYFSIEHIYYGTGNILHIAQWKLPDFFFKKLGNKVI